MGNVAALVATALVSLLGGSICGCGSHCDDAAVSSGGVITVVHAKGLLAGKTTIAVRSCVNASCTDSSVAVKDAPYEPNVGWVPVYADRETITINVSPAPPSRAADKTVTVTVDVEGKQFSASASKVPVEQSGSCDPDPSVYGFSVSFDAAKLPGPHPPGRRTGAAITRPGPCRVGETGLHPDATSVRRHGCHPNEGPRAPSRAGRPSRCPTLRWAEQRRTATGRPRRAAHSGDFDWRAPAPPSRRPRRPTRAAHSARPCTLASGAGWFAGCGRDVEARGVDHPPDPGSQRTMRAARAVLRLDAWPLAGSDRSCPPSPSRRCSPPAPPRAPSSQPRLPLPLRRRPPPSPQPPPSRRSPPRHPRSSRRHARRSPGSPLGRDPVTSSAWRRWARAPGSPPS